jgi:hypothetical protein
MAIRIMDDTMTLETGNRVATAALVGERAARRGSTGLSAWRVPSGVAWVQLIAPIGFG